MLSNLDSFFSSDQKRRRRSKHIQDHQKVYCANMDMLLYTNECANVHGAEREANKTSEFNYMLPKQKHTFVIHPVIPWSAF